MRFPIDVISRGAVKKESEIQDKAKLILLALFIVSAILYVFLSNIVEAYGVPKIVLLAIFAALYITVFIFIFRFMIYREQDKMIYDQDSILPYFKVKNKVNNLDGLNVYYHDDNSPFIMIRFRKGLFNLSRMNKSLEIIQEIMDKVAMMNMSPRFIVLKEIFSETEEYKYMMKTIEAIEDPHIKATTLKIYEKMFDIVNRESNVSELYLKIGTSGKLFEYDLVNFVAQVKSICQEKLSKSSFRSIELIGRQEITQVLVRFLHVGILDLSSAEVTHAVENKSHIDEVAIKFIVTEENRIYAPTDNVQYMNKEIVKEIK